MKKSFVKMSLVVVAAINTFVILNNPQKKSGSLFDNIESIAEAEGYDDIEDKEWYKPFNWFSYTSTYECHKNGRTYYSAVTYCVGGLGDCADSKSENESKYNNRCN